jgi:hypothetical protein
MRRLASDFIQIDKYCWIDFIQRKLNRDLCIAGDIQRALDHFVRWMDEERAAELAKNCRGLPIRPWY